MEFATFRDLKEGFIGHGTPEEVRQPIRQRKVLQFAGLLIEEEEFGRRQHCEVSRLDRVLERDFRLDPRLREFIIRIDFFRLHGATEGSGHEGCQQSSGILFRFLGDDDVIGHLLVVVAGVFQSKVATRMPSFVRHLARPGIPLFLRVPEVAIGQIAIERAVAGWRPLVDDRPLQPALLLVEQHSRSPSLVTGVILRKERHHEVALADIHQPVLCGHAMRLRDEHRSVHFLVIDGPRAELRIDRMIKWLEDVGVFVESDGLRFKMKAIPAGIATIATFSRRQFHAEPPVRRVPHVAGMFTDRDFEVRKSPVRQDEPVSRGLLTEHTRHIDRMVGNFDILVDARG